jgi:putative transposase
VRDREAAASDPGRIRFTPSILPPYMRRSKSIETLLPILYLKGISTGDWRWRRCSARMLPGCRHPPSAA